MGENERKNKKDTGKLGRELNGAGLNGIGDFTTGLEKLNSGEATFLAMQKAKGETSKGDEQDVAFDKEAGPRAF